MEPLAPKTRVLPIARILVRPAGLGRLEVLCPGWSGPFRVDLWDWQGRLMRSAQARGGELGEEGAVLDVRPGTLPGGAYLLGVKAEGRQGYRKLVLPL